MIVFLRLLFSGVLLVMIVSTIWASLQAGIFAGGAELLRNPWGVMTLVDAYFGFLTFYVWVAYKERTTFSRVIWFVSIMLLGNIAMSAYMLVELFLIDRDAPLEQVLLRRRYA
jgi:hypothetical protein